MYNKRLSAKSDANQPDIVKELRKISGVSVELDHDDIFVGYKGVNYWVEIKTPECKKKDGTFKAGTFKPSQIKLMETWQGQYSICTTTEEVLKVIGVIK